RPAPRACRRSRPRGGSVPRLTAPPASSHASNPAPRGGRRGRSSPHPRANHRHDRVRRPVSGIDDEVENPGVANIDAVNRLVPDPLRLLARDDLPPRLPDARLLAPGTPLRPPLTGRVPQDRP